MARQKFDADFNNEIRRTVKSFNQRLIRAERRGMRNLPSRVSVSQLKARYTTKTDMKHELGLLRKMNLDPEAMKRKKLGDTWIVNWEYDYLKDKLKDVKHFYNVMIEMAKDRYKDNPDDIGLRDEYINLQERVKLLDRNLDDLSYSDLRSMRSYINKYETYGTRDNDYFDTYLSALQSMLENSSLDADTIKQLKEKFNSLTPQEFSELVRRHDVISDVFKYVNSPKDSLSEQVARAKRRRERSKLEKALRKQDAVWMEKFGKPLSTSDKFFNIKRGTTTQDVDNFLLSLNENLDDYIQETTDSFDEFYKKLSPKDKRDFNAMFGKS